MRSTRSGRARWFITMKCCSTTLPPLTPLKRGSALTRSKNAQRRRRSKTAFSPMLTLSRSYALTLLTSALLLSGCAGYKLGPTNGVVAREKSVQFNPFADQTLQPRLTDAIALQLRKELQRDGTYSLATHNDGDIIVTGSLLRYQRYEVSFASNDILTVRDFRIILSA